MEDKSNMKDTSNVKDINNKEEGNKAPNKELDCYEKIVDRAHKEIQRVRLAYIFLITSLGILLAFGIYFTFDSMGDFRNELSTSMTDFRNELRELRKEIEIRVDKELSKEPIQKLIRERVSEQVDKVAIKIIGEKIDEKATPLIRDVEIQVKDLQSRLVAIEDKVNQIIADSEKKIRAVKEETEKTLKAMQIESKFLLTVLRAQNGDKQSWLELVHIAEKEQGTEQGEFAAGAVRRIYDDFFKTGFLKSKYYLPSISDSKVVENLKDNWPHKRKMAVYTIKKRSMYDQIPDLISMVPLEENLDVLAEIYRVLNELLGTDIKITEVNNALRFKEAWEAKKKQLEETKGDKK